MPDVMAMLPPTTEPWAPPGYPNDVEDLKLAPGTASGYKGVVMCTDKPGRCYARLRGEYLGHFASPVEAAVAYAEKQQQRERVA